jgi:DNA-binding NtrC family response regulator
MHGLYAVNGGGTHLPASGRTVSLLLLSADHAIQNTISGLVSWTNWKLQISSSLDDVLARLSVDFVPVILADEKLPGGGWKRLVEQTARMPFPPRVIVMSAAPDTALWEAVVLSGGYHVLGTPLSSEEFFHEVFEAWQSAKRLWERTAPKGPHWERGEPLSVPSAPAGAA